jgi:hypothetical protein
VDDLFITVIVESDLVKDAAAGLPANEFLHDVRSDLVKTQRIRKRFPEIKFQQFSNFIRTYTLLYRIMKIFFMTLQSSFRYQPEPNIFSVPSPNKLF